MIEIIQYLRLYPREPKKVLVPGNRPRRPAQLYDPASGTALSDPVFAKHLDMVIRGLQELVPHQSRTQLLAFP